VAPFFEALYLRLGLFLDGSRSAEGGWGRATGTNKLPFSLYTLIIKLLSNLKLDIYLNL